MPTVLARAGLDNETDCHGGLLSTDFTVKNSTHPVEYRPDVITSTLCALDTICPSLPAACLVQGHCHCLGVISIEVTRLCRASARQEMSIF